jgi:hypothetical protein
VEITSQRCNDPIPAAAVIAPAVDEQKRWCIPIAPVDVMQPQTLGKIVARDRADRFGQKSSGSLTRLRFQGGSRRKVTGRVLR